MGGGGWGVYGISKVVRKGQKEEGYGRRGRKVGEREERMNEESGTWEGRKWEVQGGRRGKRKLEVGRTEGGKEGGGTQGTERTEGGGKWEIGRTERG